MRKDITVAAEVRTSRGKNEARRTRARREDSGGGLRRIPGSGRGGGQSARDHPRSSTATPATTPSSTWRSQGGENTPVMVVDQQVDPIRALCCTPI